jgi:hypothetical protein
MAQENFDQDAPARARSCLTLVAIEQHAAHAILLGRVRQPVHLDPGLKTGRARSAGTEVGSDDRSIT